jgi:hypothetical protein
MMVKNSAVLELRLAGKVIKTIRKNHVQPSEMINLTIGPKELKGFTIDADSALEFSII